jgi:hypothetical protein
MHNPAINLEDLEQVAQDFEKYSYIFKNTNEDILGSESIKKIPIIK